MSTEAETRAENRRSATEAIAALESADKALRLYNTLMDRLTQWETVKAIIDDLNSFQSDYSNEGARIIGKVKTLMTNASNEYASAAQSIYEWCSLASILLVTYVQLLKTTDQRTSAAQTTLLVKVLDEGITKMNAAQTKLDQSSSSFKKVSGKLTTLDLQLQNAFDSKISHTESVLNKVNFVSAIFAFAAAFYYFEFKLENSIKIADSVRLTVTDPIEKKLEATKKLFSTLKSKLSETSANIDVTVAELKSEVRIISELKIQTEATKAFIPLEDILRDTVIEAAETLIRQCNEYCERHSKNL